MTTGDDTLQKLERTLCYLSSDPVYVGGVPIYPVSIQDIRRLGYVHYRMNLGLLCLTPEQVQEMMQGEKGVSIPFYFLLSILEYHEADRKIISEAFQMVTREPVTWDIQEMKLYCGDGILTVENFPAFQNIVRERNQFDVQTADENPADERTRALLRRSRELEKRRAKARGDEDGITLADIVSICAARLGVHPDVIGQYDMFQLYDLLGRLKMYDEYEVGVEALLHGASKDDVELKHWLSGNQNIFEN